MAETIFHGKILKLVTSRKNSLYLPDNHLFTAKFVQQAHLTKLHGGLILTMVKIRERDALDSLAEKSCQESAKKLLGLQKIPSLGLRVSTPG